MKKIIFSILLILLLLLGLAYGGQKLYWNWTHVTVGGVEYPLDLEALDLSGQDVSYIKELPNLLSLKQLDLRNTGLTVEDCLWLRSKMPECEILWLVPFQGNYLTEDTKEITVTDLSNEDIAVLGLLEELETVDGRGCPDPAPLLELQKRFPEVRVLYSVELEGSRYDWDTETLTLTGLDFSEMHQIFPLLPKLSSVTLTEPVADGAGMTSLMEAFPDIAFEYCLTLYGQTLSLDVEYLDLTGIPLESTEDLEAALPHLTQLRHVEMVDCGIPDEEMGRLNQTWEDVLFAWEVTIGHFKVRNDITYFMPYQYKYELTDKDADQLKYLTELICIDFGHMDITRSDYLAYMTKMQYLLLCDTPIHDISGCANMPDLKYVEVFMTEVTDYAPLLACPNLVDLNVSYTIPDDPMIFAQMTQLENLWIRGYDNEAWGKALQERMPNTRIVYTEGSSTARGWRELPNYYAQRDILGMWYMEG